MGKTTKKDPSRAAIFAARDDAQLVLTILDDPEPLTGIDGTMDLGLVHSLMEAHSRVGDSLRRLMREAVDAQVRAKRPR